MTPEEIARALASLRHDEPVPDDVARRLDDRLAALQAEREDDAADDAVDHAADDARPHAAGPRTATDPESPSSPRRRRVLWVAAAACVAALAGGQLLGDGVGVLSGSGSESATSGDADSAGAESAGGETAAIEPGAPVVLSSSRFPQQVRRLAAQEPRRSAATDDTDSGGTGGDTGSDPRSGGPASGTSTLQVGPRTCRTPPAGPGSRLLPATYDGGPAVLEIGPDTGTLWACDGRRVLNETGLAE